MRVSSHPAFVLHRRAWRETSLLLEVFTRGHGRLGLIAKGSRRPRNPVRGILMPFQPLLIGWSGRGELAVLTGAEPDSEAVELPGEALPCGFYLNELLVRLLHRHDPHEALFDDYRAALRALRDPPVRERVLRVFEKRLLTAIGYGLVLDHDIADNSPICASDVYDYILDRGPLRCVASASPSTGVRVRGATLLALHHEALDEETLAEAKALMRAALARHLGPRPLASRALFAHRPASRSRNLENSE